MKLRCPTLDVCKALADRLRTQGFVPCRVGHPGALPTTVPERFIRITEHGTDGEPVRTGVKRRALPTWDFYAAPVLSLAAQVGAQHLLVQARTKWWRGTSHDVWWAPEWFVVLAHAPTLLTASVRAALPVTLPELMASTYEGLKDCPDAQAGLRAFYDARIGEIKLALESADMLGGPDAVETLLAEVLEAEDVDH